MRDIRDIVRKNGKTLERSYGIQVMRPAEPNTKFAKFCNQIDHRDYNRGMHWFNYKDELVNMSMPRIAKFNLRYSEERWKNHQDIPHTVKLYAVDDEIPPDYGYPSEMYEIGRLTTNAKNHEAEKIRSTKGVYYKVTYILQIEYGRKKIKFGVPTSEGSEEIECDYKIASSHRRSVDHEYGSDQESDGEVSSSESESE